MLQEFVQQMNDTIRDEMKKIHTALPGKIISFDSSTGLALVEPVAKMMLSDGELMEYPQIANVPVVFPQGNAQGVSITFPVKEGDNCLLIFSEQALDLWAYGYETYTVLTHDLTNAICIPGLFNKASSDLLEACGENAVIVRSGRTKLKVSGSGITIKGNVTVDGNITATGTVEGSGAD